MKRAFTLIEMLIVVVVLVTLMSIAFRLGSLGSDEEARITTVTRLQRLENCLSGYNAAFGSYPPVRLHASRDFYAKVDESGRQSDDGETVSELKWESVRAACRAQPLGMAFPFGENKREREHVKRVSDAVVKWWQQKQQQQGASEGAEPKILKGFGIGNEGLFRSYLGAVEWNDVQLFRFGVMSFLLPRYLVMMDGEKTYYEYAQWTANNMLPCNPWTGTRFNKWNELQTTNANTSATLLQAQIKYIPSQAVTARWMPNLQGICSSAQKRMLFGVSLNEKNAEGGLLRPASWQSEEYVSEKLHTVGGYNSVSDNYILDEITVNDGWGNEFYYYSLPPYQSYTLWSAGANGKTFPPWMDLGMLDSESDRKTATEWLADDIVQMSN